MAVTKVKELFEGNEGTFAAPFDRSYVRRFRVWTDDPKDGSIAVGFASGLPKPYDFYRSANGREYDPLSRVVNIHPVRDPVDRCLWEVTVSYSMLTGQVGNGYSGGVGGGDGGGADGQGTRPGGGGPADAPDQRPWQVGWSTETMQLPMRLAFRDREAAEAEADRPRLAVLNSAGQPFAQVPTYDAGYLVLTVKRLQASYDPQRAKRYTYALNSDLFLGFAEPGQAQVTVYTGDQVFIGGVGYWEEVVRIRFVPDGVETWQPQVLDMGTARQPLSGEPGYLGGGGAFLGKPLPILDPLTQAPIAEPVMLRNGQPLSDADRAAGNVSYLTFYRYRMKPFSKLKLT